MKVISLEDVGSLIQDSVTVGISGSGGCGSPDGLLKALHDYYEIHHHPQNITVTMGISTGNMTPDMVGMNYLTSPGLVGKAICGHYGLGRNFSKAVANNQFPAFAIPLGVYGHLLRATMGHKEGVLTTVGLHTFVDPRIEGCKINEKAKQEPDIVELVEIDGKENLFYKSYPIQVALIKATYADKDGNIVFDHEPVISEQFELALAAHNSGGIVIVEVEDIKEEHFKAKDVLIHHQFVDYVVIHKTDVTLGNYNWPIYRPELTGDEVVEAATIEALPLNERKICGRRAALELKKHDLINLGIGVPEAVSVVASEEGWLDDLTLSVEMGPLGGAPIGGFSFGSSINPESIISTASTFDMYDGGVLDLAILGLAEVDQYGNVNVSKFGDRITGPGGFINITQNTKDVVFVGTFTTDGLEVSVENNQLHIIEEGKKIKFKKNVEQITFSGKYATLTNQNILYITERAVFRLISEGLELIEIAPGIDIDKDILPYMEFMPIMRNVKVMDEIIFKNDKMNRELSEK